MYQACHTWFYTQITKIELFSFYDSTIKNQIKQYEAITYIHKNSKTYPLKFIAKEKCL